MTYKPTWADPIDLNIEDLCVYVGSTEFSSLNHRVIYKVTNKEPSGWSDGQHLSRWHFTFEPVFDMFPTTHDERVIKGEGTKRTKNGTRYLVKLSVIELGLLRSVFDDFLQTWAKNT